MLNLTEEQKHIIHFQDDIIVEAAAGSGKTFTCFEKTKAMPDKSFLYLAFNRSVAEEARNKFGRNTKAVTAHGLAWRALNVGQEYDLLKGGSLQSNDVQKALDIEMDGPEDFYGLKLASHIRNKFNLFCNSNETSINDIAYDKIPFGDKALLFIDKYGAEIDNGAERLWDLMLDKKTSIPHDFYLKLYSLYPPALNYDWIIWDEAQDASPCMINIIKNQKAKRLVISDKNQEVYKFRGSIGDLSGEFDYKRSFLSKSFRFRQDIADLCMNILRMKENYLDKKIDIDIIGGGKCDETESKAVIARSNVALFKAAVHYASLLTSKDIKFYFEGGFKTYLMFGSAHINDILWLKLGCPEKVYNKFLKNFTSYNELIDYVDDSEDRDLSVAINLVDQYGRDLFGLIKKLKVLETENKYEADIIFSTVHRFKGLQSDVVELTNDDFVTADFLAHAKGEGDMTEFKKNNLAEQVNILYVAASRAKNKLIFPNGKYDFSHYDILKESAGDTMMGYLKKEAESPW